MFARCLSVEQRGPEYRVALERVLPGAFAQSVADAGSMFDVDLALLDWRFGEAEARFIIQPVLAVLGGDSDALLPRFSETQRLLLAWIPHAEEFVGSGTTHFTQLESPRGMAEALAAFFARHPLRT